MACGPGDALAFDLARSGRRAACAAPAAQLVLQYSLLVPGPAPRGAPPGSRCARELARREGRCVAWGVPSVWPVQPLPSSGRAKPTSPQPDDMCPSRPSSALLSYELRRFMRVLTAAAPLAATPAALYASCDADAVAALAVHKCLLKVQEDGVLVSMLGQAAARAVWVAPPGAAATRPACAPAAPLLPRGRDSSGWLPAGLHQRCARPAPTGHLPHHRTPLQRLARWSVHVNSLSSLSNPAHHTQAARQMLFDWLVLLTARVAELVGGRGAKASAQGAHPSRLTPALFAAARAHWASVH